MIELRRKDKTYAVRLAQHLTNVGELLDLKLVFAVKEQHGTRYVEIDNHGDTLLAYGGQWVLMRPGSQTAGVFKDSEVRELYEEIVTEVAPKKVAAKK